MSHLDYLGVDIGAVTSCATSTEPITATDGVQLGSRITADVVCQPTPTLPGDPWVRSGAAEMPEAGTMSVEEFRASFLPPLIPGYKRISIRLVEGNGGRFVTWEVVDQRDENPA